MGLNTDYLDRDNECEYAFAKEGPFWHLCTPGEGQCAIFLDDEEFEYAITTMGMSLAEHAGVSIFSYAVMTNHIHMVLSGTEAECRAFFETYFHLIKRFLGKRGRVLDLRVFHDMELIPISDLKMLRNEIVYVHRNGFVEGASPTPYSYPWGSGRYFFSLDHREGTPVDSLTVRQKRKMSHKAEFDFPSHFTVIDNHLNPESFCQFETAQSLFHNGQQYFAMLSKNLEAFSEIAKRLGDRVLMTDSEVYPLTCSICRREYDVKSPAHLSPDQKIVIAKLLHEKFNAGNKQISRVLGLPLATVNQLYPLRAAKPRR